MTRKATKPAMSKPAKSKPAKSRPAKSRPAKSKPAKSKPAKSKPAKSKPAKSKPAKSKPAKATTATQSLGSGWHTWPARPDEAAVRDHVDAFFQAIHGNDVARAFALSPIYTYATPLLIGASDPAAVANAVENMKSTLEDYDYLDEDEDAWYARITPPSRVGYEQLNLALPEDRGDTLANVFVDDEVTDVTCIFSLVEQDGRWQLAFKMFKVM